MNIQIKNQPQLALEAIRKKLVGKRLNYKEVYAVMDEIAKDRLGDVLTTYFAASGYSKGFSNDEIFYLTKAMVETGEKLTFKGIVADKHSIGGTPGTRTTMILVPIIAAAGFKIPKSSSRAITSPGGTADSMEVLAKVNFGKQKVKEIVGKIGGCIVWGGSFNIAPADDIIIKIEEPLLFEAFDKIIISVMAKKIAFGATHVVIDLPVGDTMKVKHMKDAENLKKKFEYIAKRFKIKIKIFIHKTAEPAGRGIGPLLEAREVLRVLQQKPNRPFDLEERTLNLTGGLLDLCLEDASEEKRQELKKFDWRARDWACYLLKTGQAWKKMQEIIKAQGGNPNIDSEDLKPAIHSFEVRAEKKGFVKDFNNKNLTVVCRILGAPTDKKAGIYLNKKIGEIYSKDDTLFTMYSTTKDNLKEAKDTLKNISFLSFS